MFVGLPIVLMALGAFQYSDTFDYADGGDGSPAWRTESIAWETRGAAMTYAGGNHSLAVLEKAPYASLVTAEATLTIHARTGLEWAVAGLALRWNETNYWHVALCESPTATGGHHSIELMEMFNGVWLAQSNGDTALKLLVSEGGNYAWEYEHPYRVRLAFTADRVDGTVSELDGTPRAHIAYALAEHSVRAGMPALDAGNFQAAFDDLSVLADNTVAAPDTRPSYPPYVPPVSGAVLAKPSGFFRTASVSGRWWLIDPVGQPFFIIGTDHANYRVHWCQKLGYAPYARNVEAKYGSEQAWGDETLRRLREWGFNTLAANHSPSLRHRGLPHIEFLNWGAAFSDVDDICPKTTWTGFPNVFSPKWERHCHFLARQVCGAVKDDPWMIGYFLDNELEWFGKNGQPWGLFDEAWKKPKEHSAKQEWVRFLKRTVHNTEALKALWGIDVASFDALAGDVTPREPLNDHARDIAREWVRLVAREYYRVLADAIRDCDPHHLIMGNRFAGGAPDIVDIAGRYCDIVSFNIYPRIDVERGVPESVLKTISQWHRAAGKPMMITEWSFPALDTDRPSIHGAGMRVDTQVQRAQCFTHFQSALFRLPYMVGSDYFMWADEPAQGISDSFPEDSNYGLVNEMDEPYLEITQAARAVNTNVFALHSRTPRLKPLARRELGTWLCKTPKDTVPQPEGPMHISTGPLHMEGPESGTAWRLSLDSVRLGDLMPMLHQEKDGHSWWTRIDTSHITAVRENARVVMVDMEVGYLAPATGTTVPCRYRAGWRYWIPRDESGWLASQCLWVENADTVAWKLVEVFHYLLPCIGGDPLNDEPLTNGVANYYLAGSAWTDPAANTGVGCWYADERAFASNYWKDPQGGFHADLRHGVDKELRPGQRLTINGPHAFFFGFENGTREAFGEAVARMGEVALR